MSQMQPRRHSPVSRRDRIEAAVERLIDALDVFDGDPDLEPDADDEPNGDLEDLGYK